MNAAVIRFILQTPLVACADFPAAENPSHSPAPACVHQPLPSSPTEIPSDNDYPSALAIDEAKGVAYVACGESGSLAIINLDSKVSARIAMPGSATGIALSKDGSRLFVTCASPRSTVCVVDTRDRQIKRKRQGECILGSCVRGDKLQG